MSDNRGNKKFPRLLMRACVPRVFNLRSFLAPPSSWDSAKVRLSLNVQYAYLQFLASCLVDSPRTDCLSRKFRSSSNVQRLRPIAPRTHRLPLDPIIGSLAQWCVLNLVLPAVLWVVRVHLLVPILKQLSLRQNDEPRNERTTY